jgi:hypothetical protein
MKKYLLNTIKISSLFLMLFVVSCKKEKQVQSPNYTYNFNIDGQVFSWQGNDTTNYMSNSWSPSSYPHVLDFDLGSGRTLSIKLPSYSLGAYTLNPSNFNIYNNAVFTDGTTVALYSTNDIGSDLTVSITQIPSSINGVVTGNISGFISSKSISGLFEARRR